MGFQTRYLKVAGTYGVGDGNSQHDYTLQCEVQFDSAEDNPNPQSAFEAVEIPLGTAFSYNGFTDLYSFLKTFDFETVDQKGLFWQLNLHYSAFSTDQNQENPLNNKPRIYLNGIPYDTFLGVDVNGNAVLNSAGDPFDPTIPRKNTRVNIRVERNEINFNTSTIALYQNTVNQATFLGFDPGLVLCTHIETSIENAPVCGYYVKVTYEFELETAPPPNQCVPGWQPAVADVGLRYIDSSGKQANILDDNGQPVTSPKLLNGSGGVLPDGTPPAQAVFLQFQGYNTQDFNDFAFDFGYLQGILNFS